MPDPTLPLPFLGTISEICIVTPSYKKTIDGLLRLGIGPFQIFDFNATTVRSRSFRGKAGDFELKVCFAKQGELVFEIMQPVGGRSLMGEWLEEVCMYSVLVLGASYGSALRDLICLREVFDIWWMSGN